jgi:glycosyltransferase involved in cell wall biosynthesis
MTKPPPRRSLRIFIAHASDCLTDHHPHGDGLVAEAFIRHLAERDHRIEVAIERAFLQRPMLGNVTLHPIVIGSAFRRLPRLGLVVGVRRLFRRLQAQQPFDIVHQLNPVFTGISLAVTGLHDKVVLGPFVPHWPTPTEVADRRWTTTVARDWLSRIQQRQATALLVTTPAALSRVKCPITDGEPLVVEVPHGIDVDVFRQRATLPSGPSILFLANMWRRKGIFTLLRAFERICHALPQATLTIAGRGSDEQLVKEAVDSHPGRRAIEMIGNVARADVPALLRSHAVYCLPSFGEPFGMTILEAMASGVPVVTSTAGGPGFLVDSDGGRLVRPDDDVQLAASLIEILASPDLQRSMGQHNRAIAERRFSWPRVIDRLEDAYYRVLREERSPLGDADARSTTLAPPSRPITCRS